MDLPDDKKVAVMNSSEAKKRLMLQDLQQRHSQEMPPRFYLAKFEHVMDTESPKVCFTS